MNHKKHLKIVEFLTHILDEQFSLFGFKFGLDPLVSLIPGIGDFISALVSFYIIWIAREMKIPQEKISKMYRNVIADLILGFFPVIGDISDFFYKANSKNLKILKDHLPPEILEGEVI